VPEGRIAVFVSFSGRGGVERMVLNLCQGLAALGVAVDLLALCRDVPPPEPPPGVSLRRLRARHSATSVWELADYLRRARPQALLAAKERAIRAALLARALAGGGTRLVARVGTTVSGSLAGRSWLRHWSWYLPMRLVYPRLDAVVAVSRGVAEDLAWITGLPRQRFTVIANPVVTARVLALAEEPAGHPWLEKGQPPVVLGCGRLTRQKGFAVLVQAFARLREQGPCRLIILGEGGDRPLLERQAAALGVAADVDLPGHVANPYAYMRRAALCVLSSLWEGSPNVLTEAMALGRPVVATDCPSGPRELLQDGQVAPLVPVGDAAALARAMAQVLHRPPGVEVLKRAVAEYHQDVSAGRYYQVLTGADGSVR
jgi:glycosyltransferase involved in cell wall biosynthesis